MTDSPSLRGSVSSRSTSPAPQAFYNIADEFVLRLAREHPEKLAILGTGRALTYAELEALVARVAEALRSANCKVGERVMIALPDSAELIAAFFGAAKIGAIAVPVNPMARAADYRHWLENCGARIAIVHAPILGEFGDGAAGDAALDLLVIYESTAGTVKPERVARRILEWDDWLPSRAGAVATHSTLTTDSAFYLYTSGSGGAPKAVVHRHQDMGVAARNYAQGVLGLRADDRLFSVSKLFFAYGLGNGMYFPLHFGASTILYPERPRADEIATVIAEHRPTVFFSVPTFYASLLREAEKGLELDFSSVRLAVSAGESLPA
jgi:acyl-coenzyme A synthetase/AMP-(fatty) acid ligase